LTGLESLKISLDEETIEVIILWQFEDPDPYLFEEACFLFYLRKLIVENGLVRASI